MHSLTPAYHLMIELRLRFMLQKRDLFSSILVGKALRVMFRNAKDMENRGLCTFTRSSENIDDYTVPNSEDAFNMKPKL